MMMIFEDKFLQEQAEKDGLKTWEDLRDYLVCDCGYHDLDVYYMEEFDNIMSDESLGAQYAVEMIESDFNFSNDYFYFDDWGYIHSEKEKDYQKRLLDMYAEFCEENK